MINDIRPFYPERNLLLNAEDLTLTVPVSAHQDHSFIEVNTREDKGDREGISHTHPIPSSRVIFRIGKKLPRALRGCFVEVSHD